MTIANKQTIYRVSHELVWRCLMEFERHDGPGPANRAQELRALMDSRAGAAGENIDATVCAYTPGMGRVELRLAGGLPSWLEIGEKVAVLQGPPAVQHSCGLDIATGCAACSEFQSNNQTFNIEAARKAIRQALPSIPGDQLDHGLFTSIDAGKPLAHGNHQKCSKQRLAESIVRRAAEKSQ